MKLLQRNHKKLLVEEGKGVGVITLKNHLTKHLKKDVIL